MNELEFLIEESPLAYISMFLGALFLFMGALLYFFPTKKPNMLYGYRTQRSMKDVKSWRFAQKYSSKIMIQAGVLFMLIALIGFFLRVGNGLSAFIILVELAVACFFMIWKTENELKKIENEENH